MSLDGLLVDASKHLFETKEGADITFVVHGEDIPAHKFIAYRSPFLKGMMNSDLAPLNAKHAIDDPDFTVSDFKNFLKFLYTDDCDMDDCNLVTLLRFADMYMVPQLMKKCVEYIESRLIRENIFFYSEFSILHEEICPEMIEKCIEKLCDWLPWLQLHYSTSNGHQFLISKALVIKIVKDCPRRETLTEELLFQKVFLWAKTTCQKNEIESNPENMNAVLSDIMPYFKIKNLSFFTLTTKINKYKLLPAEEYVNYLCKFMLKHLDLTKMQLTPQSLDPH